MKNIVTIVVFLIINFGALAIGSWLMDNGPQTEWYLNLNKAPWTPSGWVFGAAWTTIMICFSIYMAQLFKKLKSKKVIGLFIVQLILNVSWNYIFFNKHMVLYALVVIALLTLLMLYFFISFYKNVKYTSLLLLPYIIWLFIATSLNYYIYTYN